MQSRWYSLKMKKSETSPRIKFQKHGHNMTQQMEVRIAAEASRQYVTHFECIQKYWKSRIILIRFCKSFPPNIPLNS